MKVEIKKVGVLNVIFSVFSVAVFMVMLINGIISIFSPEVTFSVTFLMTMIM